MYLRPNEIVQLITSNSTELFSVPLHFQRDGVSFDVGNETNELVDKEEA